MSDEQPKKRIAVVTGAAAGLGQAIAHRLAESGMDVVLADLDTADETAALVDKAGGRAHSVICDVTSEASVAELATAAQDFGGCDVLVNNAGIYPFVLFEDLTFEMWRRILSTNLDSMFLTCKAFLPGMQTNGWGRVINLASNAYMNGADPMLAGYVSSKGGVIGLTRALASEYGAHGITVNAIAPGLTVTGTTIAAVGGRPGEAGAAKWGAMAALQAIKRTPTPADVVGAAAFLASEEAGFITAQTLVVDGGLARV
ncbi:SDR family NAD(P)-dependent oxidoreductase [Prauserella cavernicola]|uniref:SDR family oxidoreductase n=1 Tax=Prauserella cavernicola TaxID=2800127 RepID=A0A934QV81_9PSEU|nr:SDR family NAD(P)-dependent oxidoreductase [Prauserella cavernicola]MBK1787176.1 SDR family oxidoreductase [Prauserella cavernicola]